MARKYFTLAVREHGVWTPEFGDYDRAVVDHESRDYYRDSGIKAKDLCIIVTGDSQAAIDAAIAQLNAE